MRTPQQHYDEIIKERMANRRALPVIESRDSEWRRLAEEAQAERDRLKALLEFSAGLLKAKGTEIDRLKRELQGARDDRDRLQDERDREVKWLKGELAEARRLIKSCAFASCIVAGLSHRRRADCGSCGPCAARKYIAATPAEQAQGACKCPPDECRVSVHGQLSVHGGLCRDLAAPAAEQEQGGRALTLEMLDEVLRDHINDEYNRSTELAKRVEALETWLREFKASANEPVPAPQVRPAMGYGAVGRELMKWKELAAPPPPEAAGPTCEKLIGSLNAPCTKRRNHGGDCEYDAREAAGPGHAPKESL